MLVVERARVLAKYLTQTRLTLRCETDSFTRPYTFRAVADGEGTKELFERVGLGEEIYVRGIPSAKFVDDLKRHELEILVKEANDAA